MAADAAAVLEHDRSFYHNQINRTADLIAANAAQRPVVLLAGPSGSGKTTTALLIERELDRRGMETHTLCMDDYFCPLTAAELELLHKNELDLEKPTRVDIPFFREQLGQILAGEEIALPRFDFKNSKRIFDGRTLRRKPGELSIMAGIHAHDGSVLHPSKIRLVRRMLRDKLGRNRAFSQTVANRIRVDQGEQRYIMPFKPRAHCSIDSFHSAEMAVYHTCLLDELDALETTLPDLADVVKVLRELPALDPALVPHDSLLREFIGDSSLNY